MQWFIVQNEILIKRVPSPNYRTIKSSWKGEGELAGYFRSWAGRLAKWNEATPIALSSILTSALSTPTPHNLEDEEETGAGQRSPAAAAPSSAAVWRRTQPPLAAKARGGRWLQTYTPAKAANSSSSGRRGQTSHFNILFLSFLYWFTPPKTLQWAGLLHMPPWAPTSP